MSIYSIFSIITLVLMISAMIYTFVISKRRNNVSGEIKLGMRCYVCKEYNEDYKYSLDFNLDEKLHICKSCDRDQKLKEVIGGKKSTILNRVKKFLVSDKSKNIWIWFVVLQLTILGISVLSIFFFRGKVNYLSSVINFINVIYWVILITKIKLTTMKKTS